MEYSMEQKPLSWQRMLHGIASRISEPMKIPVRVSPAEPLSENDRLLPLLFSGNLQESIPHKLMQDSRLTPLERNAWIVFRMAMDRRGQFATSPRYKDLQPCISMVAGGKASMKTVAKVITNLRLTRWLTLLDRPRDERTGRLMSSVYILHDEPLRLGEALEIDENYVEHAAKCIEHNDKGVRMLAAQVLQEFTQVKDRLPTRIQTLIERMSEQLSNKPYKMSSETKVSAYKKPTQTPSSVPSSVAEEGTEEGKNYSKYPSSVAEEGTEEGNYHPTSAAEAGLKPSESGALPQRKKDSLRTVRTVYKYVRTEPVRAKAKAPSGNPNYREDFSENPESIPWPEALSVINGSERRSFERELVTFSPDLLRALLETTADGWQNGKVKNPAGYLRGLIERARNGQFKTTKSAVTGSQQTKTKPASSLYPPHPPYFSGHAQADEEDACSPEQAEFYRQQLRDLIKQKPSMMTA